jgi:xeroderma pigmentosum group C-complementing protein
MAGRKRNAAGQGIERRASARLKASSSPSASRSRAAGPNALPTVYREMLDEAKAEIKSQQSASAERPAKRRRPGDKSGSSVAPATAAKEHAPSGLFSEDEDDQEDGEHIEFEDVALPTPVVQTIERESEDEDDDIEFEDVDFDGLPEPSAVPKEEPQKEFNLNLTARQAAMAPRRAADRRKPVTKEEKERRIEIHKMHLLCLLAHVERRNNWCNDVKVQDILQPLLTDKTVKLLNPDTSMNQFSQTESLKRGLQEASIIFKTKFSVTERGIRRALWAEKEEQLQNVGTHIPRLVTSQLTLWPVQNTR